MGGTWSQLPEGHAVWTASSGAGETISAGLPNIIGKTTDVIFYKDVIRGEGAFVTGDTAAYWDSNKGGDYVGRRVSLWFDASCYNSIYGASSTVQPQAIKIYAWKRIS